MPIMTRAAILDQGAASGLGNVWNRARCPWIDLEHEDFLVLDCHLDVHQSTDRQMGRQLSSRLICSPCRSQ